MRGTIDSLPETSSPFCRRDPRWKLAGITLAGVAIVVVQGLIASLLGGAVAVAFASAARLPLRWTLERLGVALLVLLPFLALLPFVQRDAESLWSLGPLWFSLAGVWLGVILALKSLALVLLVLILLATTPLPGLFKAAQALRVPGLIVHLAALAYRYIGVLEAELGRLRIALRVRGYRNRATVHCYRTVGHVAGTLFVRGYEQAERVDQAMRCRGFDGRFRTLHDFHTRPADIVFFIVILAGAAGLLLLDHFA